MASEATLFGHSFALSSTSSCDVAYFLPNCEVHSSLSLKIQQNFNGYFGGSNGALVVVDMS